MREFVEEKIREEGIDVINTWSLSLLVGFRRRDGGNSGSEEQWLGQVELDVDSRNGITGEEM